MWNNTCKQHPSQWRWELSGRLIFERHIWPDLHRAWKHECARHQCVNERHFVQTQAIPPLMVEARGRPEEKGHRCVGVRCLLVTGIMEWPGLGCSELLCTCFIHGPHHSLLYKNGIAQEWQTDWERGSCHGVPSGCPEHLHVSLFTCMTLLPLLYFSRRLSLFKGKSQKIASSYSSHL